MSGTLLIKKRTRGISVNTRLLRNLTQTLLKDVLNAEDFDLGIYIVRAPEMSRLNENFLKHTGSTDVITFNYSDQTPAVIRHSSFALHGEIFICIDDAITQSRQFRTSWQSELARYAIHGILHLLGYDDIRPADRRKMKREEGRLLKKVGSLFPLSKLAADSKLAR